jgi:hypothetical protein
MMKWRPWLLVCCTAIVAIACASLAWKTLTLRAERRIAASIQKLDGWAFFDDQADGKYPVRLFPRLRGVAFYARSQATDADLAILREIPQLEELFLGDVKITDAGLVHLRELKSLQGLQLATIPISDDGVRNLRGLKNLRWLQVKETLVTPSAIAELQAALPRCKIEYQEDHGN